MRNFARDAVDLPANTVTSVAHLTDTAFSKGPLKAGEEFVKGTVETLKHPTDHPLYFGLVATGGLRGGDRAAGKAMRTVPGPTRRIASREGRAPLEVPGTKKKIQRRYSKGPVGKAVQKAVDADSKRRRVKRGGPVNPPASARDIKRSLDLESHAEKMAARSAENRAEKEARVATGARRKVKRKHRPTAATSLAAQGIADISRADLQAYLSELATVKRSGKLDRVGRQQNQRTQKLIEEAIDKFDPVSVKQAAQAFSALSARYDKEMIDLGLIKPDDAEATRLVGPAVRRHGASGETLRTAKEKSRETKKVLRSQTNETRRELRRSEKELERARSGARVSVSRRKQSAELKAAARARDEAVRKLALLQRQVAAKRSRNAAVRKHSNARARGLAEAGLTTLQQRVGDARQAVRDAEARLAAERERIKGVAPAEADRLRAALQGKDEARQARSAAIEAEKVAGRERNQLRKALYVSDRGKALTAAELRGSSGINPAYVSHQPLEHRSPAIPVDRPAVPVKQQRTGEKVRRGDLDVHPEKMVEQIRSNQRLISAVKARMRFIEGWGYRETRDGKVETFSSQEIARDWARTHNLRERTGHEGMRSPAKMDRPYWSPRGRLIGSRT